MYRASGALVVLVAIQLSVPGLYLPPVFKAPPSYPPQTIISLPVQTEGAFLGEGALVVLVAVQLSVLGLYLPPVSKEQPPVKQLAPPPTIISLPLHTAVCPNRAVGALVVLVDVQLSMLGLYVPPVFRVVPFHPPQTIISLPANTAV